MSWRHLVLGVAIVGLASLQGIAAMQGRGLGPVPAQTGTVATSLQGTIIGSDNQPLAGLPLRLQSQTLRLDRSVSTDKEGSFRVDDIRVVPGITYRDLSISAPGFVTVTPPVTVPPSVQPGIIRLPTRTVGAGRDNRTTRLAPDGPTFPTSDCAAPAAPAAATGITRRRWT